MDRDHAEGWLAGLLSIRCVVRVLSGIAAGLLLGCSFLLPGTALSAALGWMASFLILVCLRRSGGLALLLCGTLAHLVGFYWLAKTVSFFGGLPQVAGWAILFIFSVAHGLYFPAAAWISEKILSLSRSTNKNWLAHSVLFALVFSSLESSPLRLFPWHLGATQLALPFSQIADIGGVNLISFLMLVVSALILARRKIALILGVVALASWCFYGVLALNSNGDLSGRNVSVALLQANVSIEDKHNEALITTNVQEYVRRTNELKGADLTIWPESVIMVPLPLTLNNASEIPELTGLDSSKQLLLGAISGNYNSLGELTSVYNSALQIVHGEISSRYHKRFIVPFGETVPFIETFPWLINLTPFMIPISPGLKPGIMTFSDLSGAQFTVGALICYEDLLPWMSRESAELGANLLVNMTNDAWFGGGVALKQHHLLASFRAIENRRPLLRVTNTGLTGVVDRFGRTVSELPPNSDGTLLAQVPVSSYKSIYTRVAADRCWQLVLAAVLILVLLGSVPKILRKKR